MTDEEYNSLHNDVDFSIPVFEIARYEPWKYDSNGRYIPFDWSEYLDIGSIFEGKAFTKAEYLIYENRMVEAVSEILMCCNIKKLKVLYLERSDTCKIRSAIRHICKDLGIKVHPKTIRHIISLHQGSFVSIIHIPLIMRLLLRDVFYCELFAPKEKVYFYTPGNYYVWIRANMAIEEVRNICDKFHIFVNPRENDSLEYYKRIYTSEY